MVSNQGFIIGMGEVRTPQYRVNIIFLQSKGKVRLGFSGKGDGTIIPAAIQVGCGYRKEPKIPEAIVKVKLPRIKSIATS